MRGRGLPLALGLLLALSVSAGPRAATASAEAAAHFEILQGLVGDWVSVEDDGSLGETVLESARLTAGGTAIVATEFPGTDHEMVTVYHRDATGGLVSQHYCVLGNQPRYRIAAGPTPRSVVLRCDGTGVASEDEKHVHEGRFTFHDDGRLESEWLVTEKGETVARMHSLLARRGE